MLLIILGILDLLSAATLGLLLLGITVKALIIGAAIYLGIKGLVFLGDFASIIDLIIAMLLVASLIITLPKFLIIVLAIVLIQKAIFSFASGG